MHQTKSFVSSTCTPHDPSKAGMTLVRGRVYRDVAGSLFVRQPETTVQRYHRTGKPATSVDYVGVPTDLSLEDLEVIVEAKKSAA